MKRMDRDDSSLESSQSLATGLAAAETMRNAVQAVQEKDSGKKDEEKLSIYWRVFGGTVVSVIALVAINLFNNMYGSISELRKELNTEREARANLVKKDEFQSRTTTQYERIRAVEGLHNTIATLRSEHDAIKESVKSNAAAVETVKKETAAIDSLRERITAAEGMKKELASLDVAKEKLAGLAADMKALREEFNKVTQEITQNRVADMERKTLRDTQARQYEETFKELGRGMQELREKLARLEGQQPMAEPKAIKLSRPRPETEVAPAPGAVTPASGTKE